MGAWALATMGGAAMAEGNAFATRAEAMRYLRETLPAATAANPKYLTKADGTLSQWLTKDIAFADGEGGSVKVTMRESFSQTKDGKTVEGRHEARFSLGDVTVTAFREPGDVTPSGEASEGVLLTCTKPGCIAAYWGATAAPADKTDISIQDPQTRAKIVAAFRRLQTP